MNVTKCENGHFFDLETFTCCPHCGAGVFTVDSKEKSKAGADTASVKIDKKSKEVPADPGEDPKEGKPKKIWPFHNKKDKTVAIIEEDQDEWDSISFRSGVAGKQMETESENAEKPAKKMSGTIQIFEEESVEPIVEPSVQPVTPSVMERPVAEVRPVAPVAASPVNIPKPGTPTPSAVPKPMKTVGIFQNVSNEPVTGWLVCIEGEMQGESYNIVSGNNKIGRNIDMDISIADASVSGENQAVLTFDPRSQMFYIKPGEGKALMYFNDEEEFFDERRKLKAYDRITIGNARFIFVPLCGEQFNWKDYLKESRNDG